MPIFVFMCLAFFDILWANFHGKPKWKIPLQKFFLKPRKTIHDKLVASASIIFIILLQKCASFYSWSPTDVFRMQFLQPSGKLSRSCASSLCKPLAIMSHSSTSFHLFFGLFFCPLTSKCSAFPEPSFSSILSTSLFTFIHITFETFSKNFPCWSNPRCYSFLSSSFHTEYIAEVREPVFVSFGFTTPCNHFCNLQLED